jgi:hypothetical protein
MKWIKGLLCKIFGHTYQTRNVSESYWRDRILHTCKRCGHQFIKVGILKHD